MKNLTITRHSYGEIFLLCEKYNLPDFFHSFWHKRIERLVFNGTPPVLEWSMFELDSRKVRSRKPSIQVYGKGAYRFRIFALEVFNNIMQFVSDVP